MNGTKPNAKEVLYQLIEFSQGHSNLRLLFEKRSGALIGRPGLSEVELAKKSDILLVAGGDGSLIDVVDSVFPAQVPILGVNIGSLGFLTAVSETEVEKILPYVSARNLLLSPRPRPGNHLSSRQRPAAVHTVRPQRHRGGARQRLAARPDSGGDRRLSRHGIRLRRADCLDADGLHGLLSRGGRGRSSAPTRIRSCSRRFVPHTLTNRALVVGTDQVIRVRVIRQPGVPPPGVQFDGRSGGNLRTHEWLEIKPAKARVQLAYLPDTDFYRVLRQKLKWSGASV